MSTAATKDRVRRTALLRRHNREIVSNGFLGVGNASTYVRRNVARFGRERTIPASKTIAAQFSKPGEPKPCTPITQIGDAPKDFGKLVGWCEKDSALALVAFLNAADPMGVAITGVKTGDTIEFIDSAGTASFSEDTENEGVGAFISVIAAGAKATSSAFGAPELVPVLTAAEKFAQEQFKEKKIKTMRRNVFGEDDNGNMARQEGGVMVSLPQARRTYTSGEEEFPRLSPLKKPDLFTRWVKKPGTRDAAHMPDHVIKGSAYFLRGDGSLNRGRASADGTFLIYPWDWNFDDNFGFYRLNILVKRGKPPPVVE